MRVRTPTSSEKIRRYIRLFDVSSVMVAGPIAVALRDPNLFNDVHIGATVIYCSIGFVAGLSMLIVFHLGKNLSDYVSIREVYAVVASSLATTALSSLLVFSFNRLDFVPRSLPLIHFLVLTMLMFAGRVIATKRRESRENRINRHTSKSQHILIVGANRFAWSYLRMLDALNIGESNIVAILDDNPKLHGRSLFGHTVIGPRSALPRVVAEYRVHGVHVDRVLITANRPADGALSELEEYCRNSDITLKFLGDMLGIELAETAHLVEPVKESAPLARAPFAFKRFVDISASLAMFCVLLPVLVPVLVGILIDLGWPVLFWQKRIGYRGRPFLIYKFRTLHAPFDVHGRFVDEDKRISHFGRFLSRTRLDELPQLWNVLIGEMSFVGPRPLLPIDQPCTSTLRLQVTPGLTGWAQIHGGKLVSTEEKGVLDDWYVEHVSFWLDVRIILRTVSIVLFGDQSISSMGVSSPTLSDVNLMSTAIFARRRR